MREVLDQPSDDDDDDDDSQLAHDASSLSVSHSAQSDFVICAREILPGMGSALRHPARSQVCFLYSAFMSNVDPVVKILHRPSLQRYFIEDTGELDCSPGPKGWDAIRFAIYYATTTSLTRGECLQQLGEEKAVLLDRFRSATELELARADVVNTEDMSTLQALVLYLVSCFAESLPVPNFSRRKS